MLKRNCQILIGFLLSLVGIVLLVYVANQASAETITVDDDGDGEYDTIQDAIDNATDGDTIRVWEGTYNENVVVDKTLSLIGNGSEVTTIDADGSGTVVKITANRVNINGFRIKNSGTSVPNSDSGIYIQSDHNIISNNNIEENKFGINIRKHTNNTVMDNIIQNNSYYGITLSESDFNIISNNFMPENWHGIAFSYAENNSIISNTIVNSGTMNIIFNPGSNSNTIENNTLTDSTAGINFYTFQSKGSYYNMISNNSCIGNYYGMLMRDSDYNTVSYNNLRDSGYSAIYLGSCNNNEFTFNTIIENGIGIYLWDASVGNKVHNNTISGNNDYGISATDNDGHTINATHNWWGHATGPYHQDNNTEGEGDTVTDYVLFDPWTDEEYDTGPHEWYVDDDAPDGGDGSREKSYNKIQDAINASEDGDTIRVWEGTYQENMVVNKSVNLIGNGSHETRIEGDRTDHVVTITADHVNISGFTITGSGTSWDNAGIYGESNHSIITDNNCSNNHNGIHFRSSDNMTITNNTCSSNGYSGIYLISSENSILEYNICTSNDYNGMKVKAIETILNDNICMFNRWGIHIEDSTIVTLQNNTCSSNEAYGISLSSSSYCTITNNICNSNIDYGIYLGSYSDHDTITGNECRHNDYAIYLGFSSNQCTITYNTCSFNNHSTYLSSSNHCTISHNQFLSNGFGDIEVLHSIACTIMNNTINGNGITLVGWNIENWNTHTIGTSNTVYGKEILYLSNTSDRTIPANAGQIIIVNCSRLRVEDQNCSNMVMGITVAFSHNNTLEDNNCSFNSDTGIYLFQSRDNILTNNICTHNDGSGIKIYSSDRETNIFDANTCSDNGGTGIDGGGSPSIFNNNVCLNNVGSGINSGWSSICDNNTCLNNGDSAISGYSSSTFTNNTCQFNNKGLDLQNFAEYNTITNNTFSNNIYCGLFFSRFSENNNINNNTISHNMHGMVFSDYCEENIIHDNHIFSNTVFGINATENEDYTVDARFNWWGDSLGPRYPNYWGNGTGDNITDNVLYDPWLVIIGNRPPIAFIDSIVPDTATPGQDVMIAGHGEDSDGHIVRHVWRLEDEELYNGTDSSFTLTDLSIGTLIISYRVLDNEGMWSDWVENNITVLLDSPNWKKGDCWKWQYYSREADGKEISMMITEEVLDTNAVYDSQTCYKLQLTFVTAGIQYSGKIWLSKDDLTLLTHDFQHLQDMDPAGSFSFLPLLTLPIDVGEGNEYFSCSFLGTVSVGDDNFTCYNFTGRYSEAWIVYSPDAKNIIMLHFPSDDGYVRMEMAAAFDREACYDYGNDDDDEDDGGGGFIPGFGIVAVVGAVGISIIMFRRKGNKDPHLRSIFNIDYQHE